ncbi:FixH family protein [Candidatus Marithrix sp. Canyon 246]|uniref:FixH family protein n=1 Tax=Candidatus Marithrix sp. Canyon 246 TaxID=1827136 RepID=UPI00084A274E|nr:FixH family protein [Candidatus Marithrix sp. Canyon 246]
MNRAWYLEPYVWLVILFPTTAIIAGMFTLYLAIESDDGLVVDDYYKQGLEINRTLERDTAAVNYGLDANLQFNADAKLIRLYLKANSDYQLPNTINLSFSHHTRSGFDQKVLLEKIDTGIYESVLPKLIAGTFTVQLAADNWRLLKSADVPMTTLDF